MQALPWKWGIEEAPAREWSEGRGALIAVAMFLGGIAGGTYLVALFFNNIWGMLAAWILAAAMGLFDMSHIKKPMRFWRIATKVNSSWISRGFILVLLFLGASGIQLIIHMVSGAAAGAPTTAEVIFRVIAGVLGFGLAIYSGFVMSYVNGIKFWNSALLPVMVVMGGLAGGAAIILAIDSFTSAADFALVLTVARASLIFYAVVLFIYLWVSTYNGQTARNSALLLLKGDMAVLFWTLIVVIGIVVPLAIYFV
ncbi:MAG: polysulfide reductase NrfD, partial [Dehalococcoidales bacterium]|nr:polysulfide reductase NrfD [Dehalococcoidales bacterium]